MDSWAALGALFGPTWVLLSSLGAFSAALGPSWAPSWGVFGRSWAVLGAPGGAQVILSPRSLLVSPPAGTVYSV